LHSGGWR
jgi:acyl carrier protein